MTMKIQTLLRQAIEEYGIKNRELAEAAGVNPPHISDIKTGKKWVSEETLGKILEGMDRIAPGSRKRFCELLAGQDLTPKAIERPESIGDKIAELVAIANDNDIEKTLQAVASRWKQGYRVNVDDNSTDILDNEEPERILNQVGV